MKPNYEPDFQNPLYLSIPESRGDVFRLTQEIISSGPEYVTTPLPQVINMA
jgi:hypothetical protein